MAAAGLAVPVGNAQAEPVAVGPQLGFQVSCQNRVGDWKNWSWLPNYDEVRVGDVANLSKAALTLRDDSTLFPEDPAWSADGSRLAVSTVQGLRISHVDGSNPTLLWSSKDLEISHPTWSPDGTTIAVGVKERNKPRASSAIWLVAVDGTGASRLVDGDSPSWSPDGTRIAYSHGGTVWTTTLDAETSQITRQPYGWSGRQDDPQWSPDGTQIAFSQDDGNMYQDGIWVVRSDGTGAGLRRVVATGKSDVAWSPDGSRLFYLVGEYIWGEGAQTWLLATSLWSVRLDGTDQRYELSPASFGLYCYSITSPRWRPVPKPAQSTRIAGVDRMETAVKVSQASFKAGGASAVVLARHDVFADAVAGGPLAAAKDAPLLLTPPGSLDSRVRDEIRRVLPAGGTVYLLGAQASLSTGVENTVRALGFNVVRLAGVDRFETSVRIAREIGEPDLLMLATGLNFPDALTAGSAAGTYGGAVLLTNGRALPRVVREYLNENAGRAVYTVGGDASAAFPDTDLQLAGRDRFETAVMVATEFFPPTTVVGLANGLNFPDALAAGPFLSGVPAPLLLTQPGTLPKFTSAYLFSVGSAVDQLVVFGGTPSVADTTAKAALAALN